MYERMCEFRCAYAKVLILCQNRYFLSAAAAQNTTFGWQQQTGFGHIQGRHSLPFSRLVLCCHLPCTSHACLSTCEFLSVCAQIHFSSADSMREGSYPLVLSALAGTCWSDVRSESDETFPS